MIRRALKQPGSGRGLPLTYADLPAKEAARVRAERRAYDLADLASFLRLTLDELLDVRELGPTRGALRSPYRLLAAIHGYHLRDSAQPETWEAPTRQVVLERLGYGNASDPGSLRRLAAAADYFGIVLPAKPRPKRFLPKPPPEPAVSTARFVRAWMDPTITTAHDLVQTLGQQDQPHANATNAGRARNLGLPPLELAGAPTVEHACPAFPPTPDPTPAPTATPVLRPVRQCRDCADLLPDRTPEGTQSWALYCNDRCRARFHERSKTAARVAANAAVQGPCQHCGTSLEARAKVRRFCDKACSKAASYQRRKAS